MARAKESATAKTEKAAGECGMTAEQWVTARDRVNVEKSRGRGITRPASSLWDAVEGQMELFD
jgi:hypothetical protein